MWTRRCPWGIQQLVFTHSWGGGSILGYSKFKVPSPGQLSIPGLGGWNSLLLKTQSPNFLPLSIGGMGVFLVKSPGQIFLFWVFMEEEDGEGILGYSKLKVPSPGQISIFGVGGGSILGQPRTDIIGIMSQKFWNPNLLFHRRCRDPQFIPDSLVGNYAVFYEIDLANRNMNVLIAKGSAKSLGSNQYTLW